MRFASQYPTVEIVKVRVPALIAAADVNGRVHLPPSVVESLDELPDEHPSLHRLRPMRSPRVPQQLKLGLPVVQTLPLQAAVPEVLDARAHHLRDLCRAADDADGVGHVERHGADAHAGIRMRLLLEVERVLVPLPFAEVAGDSEKPPLLEQESKNPRHETPRAIRLLAVPFPRPPPQLELVRDPVQPLRLDPVLPRRLDDGPHRSDRVRREIHHADLVALVQRQAQQLRRSPEQSRRAAARARCTHLPSLHRRNLDPLTAQLESF
ncbi:hypothetical protein M758_6G025200 [Ceratodon purpureus]|nr:hypothetical protein M758_6G025200 [Ceratodon purpureus]